MTKISGRPAVARGRPPGETPASERRSPEKIALQLHLASLAVATVLLVQAARGHWFFGDEWDFIVQRGLWNAPKGLLEPHNEHLSAIPIVIYRALLAVAGLEHYLLIMLPVLAAHLALTHVLWRLMLRAGVSAATATGFTAVFAVLGAGAENLLWAFQIGFVGSVLGGALACLVLLGDRPPRRRRLLAIAALCVSLLCSGIGLTAVVWATATAFLRDRDVRYSAGVLLVPTALFLVWYLALGRAEVGAQELALDALVALPEYVLNGLAAAASEALRLPGAGVVLVLAGLAFILRRPQLREGHASVVAAGAVASVVFFIINGLGRVELGAEQASSSRYVYIAAALLLPLAGVAADDLLRSTRHRVAAVAILSALLATMNALLLYSSSSQERIREQQLRDVVFSSAALLSEDTPLAGKPDPLQAKELTVEGLRRLVDKQWVPTDRATPIGTAQARANLQVQTAPAAPSNPARGLASLRTGNVNAVEVGPGCSAYTAVNADPFMVVSVPTGGGSLTATAQARGEAAYSILTTDGIQSDIVPLILPPGQTIDLTVASGRGLSELVLALPSAGSTTICFEGLPPES
jgi:hypothetical protein